jgi:putative membrane protein
MIPYPAAIAVHLLAVILFVGGLLITSLLLRGSPEAGELRRLKKWNRFVTTPALLILWIAGIHLALEAGWFAAFWLRFKLVCVATLTLLHILQSHRLETWAPDMQGGRWAKRAPLLVAFLVAAIFYLVAAKPI